MSLLYKCQTSQNIVRIQLDFFWSLLWVKLTKNHGHKIRLFYFLGIFSKFQTDTNIPVNFMYGSTQGFKLSY